MTTSLNLSVEVAVCEDLSDFYRTKCTTPVQAAAVAVGLGKFLMLQSEAMCRVNNLDPTAMLAPLAHFIEEFIETYKATYGQH